MNMNAHFAPERAAVIEPMKLRVVGVVDETQDAKSFIFESAAPLTYKPGQFLTIAVPSEEQGQVARCYSMSSAPHEGELQVTIKRTLNGYGSNWICDNVQVGDIVTVLPPSGAFTPHTFDNDLLLFAGGSGITPVISIAKAALALGERNVVLFYANRNHDSVIFARKLNELTAAYPGRITVVHWLESLQGLPTDLGLQAFARPFMHSDIYVCGPAMFMTAVANATKKLGVPRERYHQENFVSLTGNPFAPVEGDSEESLYGSGSENLETASVTGELDGVAFSFDDWPTDVTLLTFLQSKGVKAPSSCRAGECSACCFRLLEGEVEMQKNQVLDVEDLNLGYRLACQSRPVSKKIAITYR